MGSNIHASRKHTPSAHVGNLGPADLFFMGWRATSTLACAGANLLTILGSCENMRLFKGSSVFPEVLMDKPERAPSQR